MTNPPPFTPPGHATAPGLHRAWSPWAAAAFAASLWHTGIDAQIGLLGPTSEVMTLAQGAALALDALLLGWWLYVAMGAATGGRRFLGALALLLFLQPVLFDGVVAFIVAPPPSAAFPYQDLAHGASLALGIAALMAMRRSVGWGRWGWPSWVVIALKVVGGAVGAAVFFSLPA